MTDSTVLPEVDINQIATDLNGKLDRDLSNIDIGTFDVVVAYQKPTSSNNYTWYRKYASGWVEQGGYVEASSSPYTVTLPSRMANKNYYASMTPASTSSGTNPRVFIAKSDCTTTRTKLTWHSYNSGELKAYWQVSGQGA